MYLCTPEASSLGKRNCCPKGAPVYSAAHNALTFFELGFRLREFKSLQEPNQEVESRSSWTVASVPSQDIGYSWAVQDL